MCCDRARSARLFPVWLSHSPQPHVKPSPLAQQHHLPLHVSTGLAKAPTLCWHRLLWPNPAAQRRATPPGTPKGTFLMSPGIKGFTPMYLHPTWAALAADAGWP